MIPWRLDTPRQTLVLAHRAGTLPEIVYWGAALPEAEDLATLAAAHIPGVPGGGLDRVAPITVCPCGDDFLGAPGLKIDAGSPRAWHRVDRGAPKAAPTHLSEVFRAEAAALEYTLSITADPETDVFRLQAALCNTGTETRALSWFAAPVVPLPGAETLLTFSGRWCGEFQKTERAFGPDILVTEAWEGRTGHAAQPGAFALGPQAGENAGAAWGFHLGWSGGHRMVAEMLPCGRRQLQFGAGGLPATLPPGQAVETPPLYASFSDRGLNGASQAFHAHLRTRILTLAEPERPRPVHYNCWEAVYFDHDVAVLNDLADRARALGVERFVLDDGWFRGRNDDTAGLGDWQVDAAKWPAGLWPLVERVTELGMSFGLWVEPEMVNAESALFKAHPDWILGPADQTLGRTQYVLDLTRPGVADHLFSGIDALLRTYPIDYLKWDHNRPLPRGSAGQAAALYTLLARVRAAHPGVEIETCASGGGRIDFGILEWTQRVWLSDSNDALARLSIQHGASYFLPPEITGSHVGPRVCHTSGRSFALAFRAAVAGMRAMGLEMDLRALDPGEMDSLARAIADFKARRSLLHGGRLFRLEPEDPAQMGEIHLAPDGGRFLLFVAQTPPSAQALARPLRLAGLSPAARYTLRLENPDAAARPLNRMAADGFAAGQDVTLSGQALMGAGVQLPNAFPETVWVVTGTRA